jgi:ribosome maturation factor RimP
MKNEEITKKVESLIEKEVSIMGLDLVEAAFGGGVLKVTIDSPSGVSLDECVAVSRRVGILLDAEDPIPERYKLEVSSPGLTRKLSKPEDFERFTGKLVKVHTPEAVYRGILKGLVDEDVLLDIDGTRVCLKMQDIIKANLDFDF